MGTLTTCKSVHNLRFSSQGQAMLKRIQNDLSNAKIGGALLMSSTLHSLFTKTTSVASLGINVSMTDWEALSKASGDWPAAVRSIIARRAYEMTIYTNGQEQLFWQELNKCLRD